MPQELDSVGTFLGTVLESPVSETKNGFPQWTPRLRVDQKYVEDAVELAHFKLTEAQYVDYTPFDFEKVGFIVLFNADGPLMNYDQVQKAVAWDGNSFDTLSEAVGKQILFRVKEDTYSGKTSLKVDWVDAADASPTRTLKALDATGLKALNSKFLTNRKPAPKPVSAPIPAKPVAAATPAVAPAAKPVAAKAVKPAPKTPPAPPVASVAAGALPAEVDMMTAWTYVCENKGTKTDADVEVAWMAAMTAVSKGRKQEEFTTKDFANVRDQVLAVLTV